MKKCRANKFFGFNFGTHFMVKMSVKIVEKNKEKNLYIIMLWYKMKGFEIMSNKSLDRKFQFCFPYL